MDLPAKRNKTQVPGAGRARTGSMRGAFGFASPIKPRVQEAAELPLRETCLPLPAQHPAGKGGASPLVALCG